MQGQGVNSLVYTIRVKRREKAFFALAYVIELHACIPQINLLLKS